MQTPLRITLRDLPPSESIEAQIREHAEKLERFHTRLTSCHVTVDSPHKSKQHGNHFRVRIDLEIPGDELVVTRDPEQSRTHEDAHAAIDAAFHEAERLLKDHSARLRSARRGN